MNYVIAFVSQMAQHKIDNPQDFSLIANCEPNGSVERRSIPLKADEEDFARRSNRIVRLLKLTFLNKAVAL